MLPIPTQRLNRLIAAMEPNYSLDEALRKKNENPDTLRGEFYKKVNSCKNIFEYSFIKNRSTYSSLDYDQPEFSIFVNGIEYLDDDIPDDPPEYFSSGVTNIYALCPTNNPKFISSVLLVNYSDNKFSYVIGNIHDSFWSGIHHRSDLSWVYSEPNNVDFKDYYFDYPIIIKDFIDEDNVGAMNLIDYIKNNN